MPGSLRGASPKAALAALCVAFFAEGAAGGGAPAPIVRLPLSSGAACLDGSPYVFYHARNASSTRWSVYFGGGGWCYNETLCADRAASKLGTSTLQPPVGECACPYFGADGAPAAAQCNCVSLVYCDGASFSGFRQDPWPVAGHPSPASSSSSSSSSSGGTITQLMFRGLRNLDAALEYLAGEGLGDATEVVVTGGSAGGLSTFLHADRVAAAAPKAKVRALPVVGYFLDHRPETMGGGAADYRASMEHVVAMQNVTGGSGALSTACLAAHPTERWRCFMSPYAQAFVETPFFMFNSRFDFWQLGCILDVGCLCARNTSQTASDLCASGPSTCWSNPAPHNHSSSPAVAVDGLSLAARTTARAQLGSPPIVGANCNATQRADILQYGASFMTALAPVLAEQKNGAFITSCICHACDWGRLSLGGKTANAHFSDWYHGRTAGSGASALDTRGPNGDGAFGRGTKEAGWENCSDGYNAPGTEAH